MGSSVDPFIWLTCGQVCYPPLGATIEVMGVGLLSLHMNRTWECQAGITSGGKANCTLEDRWGVFIVASGHELGGGVDLFLCQENFWLGLVTTGL